MGGGGVSSLTSVIDGGMRLINWGLLWMNGEAEL